jgi:hypothetical protein
LQWLQDPSEIKGDNLSNVRSEVSRYFRNKKREYLKEKINEVRRRTWAAWEACSATWNLGTNSAFALGPRKTLIELAGRRTLRMQTDF